MTLLARKPLWASSSALLLLCSTAPVWAQVPDGLTLKMSYTLQTDSNLFRLPANANLNTLLGKPSAAERVGVTSVSVNFSKTYSLQRVELDLNLIDYHYQNFGYLSFTAQNYNAAWRWALTPPLHGNFTTGRQETLNNFSDFQGYSQRNQRTNTNTRFDTTYELDGTWRLLAGVSQNKQTNQQALLTGDDYSANSADMGLRYDFSSGSTLSYSLKTAKGQYVNRVPSAAALYDDGYHQLDKQLNLHWLITGNSTADFSLAHISRTHPNFAQRDFSGINTGVNLRWNLTGKSALTGGWTRELASNQSALSNYTQTDTLSLGPVWQVSPKTLMRLNHNITRQDFNGSPFGFAATDRTDTTRNTGLSLDWQPYQRAAFSAALQRATRDSSLAGLDYINNQATISAQFSY